jgi:hypothetical protein
MNKKISYIIALSAITISAGAFYSLHNARTELSEVTQAQDILIEQQTRLKTENDACKATLKSTLAPSCPDIVDNNEVKSELEKIYEPETDSADFQAKSDVLKKRYEELLVSYYVLKKCGISSASDYHIILSSLSHEMASLNAPGRMQYDIINAAKGAYNELYANNTCDDKITTTLNQEFRGYVAALSEQFNF